MFSCPLASNQEFNYMYYLRVYIFICKHTHICLTLHLSLSSQPACSCHHNLLVSVITTCLFLSSQPACSCHHNLLVPVFTTCLFLSSQPVCLCHHNLLVPVITTCFLNILVYFNVVNLFLIWTFSNTRQWIMSKTMVVFIKLFFFL